MTQLQQQLEASKKALEEQKVAAQKLEQVNNMTRTDGSGGMHDALNGCSILHLLTLMTVRIQYKEKYVP